MLDLSQFDGVINWDNQQVLQLLEECRSLQANNWELVEFIKNKAKQHIVDSVEAHMAVIGSEIHCSAMEDLKALDNLIRKNKE